MIPVRTTCSESAIAAAVQRQPLPMSRATGFVVSAEVSNNGEIEVDRRSEDRLTMEYLGTVTQNVTDDLRFDLSVGAQALAYRWDETDAVGQGLVNNDVRSVSAAAILLNGGQASNENRTLGVFGQADFSWRERLYVQAGLRRDESSVFGIEAKPFYSPKVGMSYVISDEPFFQDMIGILPDEAITEFRIRSAIGYSGRHPSSGARSTYDPSTNQISPSEVAIGVRPDDTGNPKLTAEKTREIEVGFDAGFLSDRLGMQFTYFRKNGRDQVLTQPVAPSTGAGGPRVNVGEILTDGFEIAADARVITRPDLAWEVRGALNTVNNKVLDLGGIPETTTMKEGYPLFGAWEYKILDVDLENERVIVSDERKYLGNGANYPGWESVFSTSITLWQSLTFYAQVDGRGDHSIYDGTTEFRDRAMGTGEVSVKGAAVYGADENGNPTEQAIKMYLKRFGPFYTETDGTQVSRRSVDGAYRQNVNTFKLREASVNYRIPTNFVQRYMRARSAAVRVSMRNVHTWTNFRGLDPESDQFLSVPQDKRWTLSMTVTF